MNKITKQEQILSPLRELYRKDINQRKAIAEYANSFKLNGVFLRQQADFLVGRLSVYKIECHSLPVKQLTVELVPSSCWFSNVRDHVSKSIWDKLRRATYKQSNYKCEICGGRGSKHPVECHEIWHYDDLKYIQTLKGLTALCPSCHQVKHIGLAGLQGYGEKASAHLALINGWSQSQTDAYLKNVWDIWHERSCHDWSLNFSWLKSHNVTVHPKR
ncbi:HNH endonuclease [Hyella patelloides]|nr:HNH endonuclease signature motif containing protein [Hyella patelloides]